MFGVYVLQLIVALIPDKGARIITMPPAKMPPKMPGYDHSDVSNQCQSPMYGIMSFNVYEVGLIHDMLCIF